MDYTCPRYPQDCYFPKSPRFSTWTENFQMFKLDLENTEEQRSHCQHLLDHRKSKRVSEKHLPLLYWLCHSLWLCGSQINCGEFFKRWEYQTIWPASWEICMQVRKQQLEPDMEQQTGSKWGKEYVKAVHCHPAYLYAEYIMWNARQDESQLESRFLGEISITSDMQMMPCYDKKRRGTKELFDEDERGEWKVDLKLNI